MPRTLPRMTLTTQAVLRVLLDEPGKQHYGLEIGTATGLPSGTVHPILSRLETLGWVDSSWEQVDPAQQGRPRRRYYRLNASGAGMARDALARAYQSRARIVGRLRPVTETT